MCFLLSLFPATVFLVLGYVVSYCSVRSEGAFGIFGKILAIWVFILALAPPLIGAYVTKAGICPVGAIMHRLPR